MQKQSMTIANIIQTIRPNPIPVQLHSKNHPKRDKKTKKSVAPPPPPTPDESSSSDEELFDSKELDKELEEDEVYSQNEEEVIEVET